MEAILDDLVCHGLIFLENEQSEKALALFCTALELIGVTCRDENSRPPLHQWEVGDVYVLAAAACLPDQPEAALAYLEKAATYECVYRRGEGYSLTGPVLGYVEEYRTLGMARTPTGHREILMERLSTPVFASLFGTERYERLIKRLKEEFSPTGEKISERG